MKVNLSTTHCIYLYFISQMLLVGYAKEKNGAEVITQKQGLKAYDNILSKLDKSDFKVTFHWKAFTLNVAHCLSIQMSLVIQTCHAPTVSLALYQL